MGFFDIFKPKKKNKLTPQQEQFLANQTRLIGMLEDLRAKGVGEDGFYFKEDDNSVVIYQNGQLVERVGERNGIFSPLYNTLVKDADGNLKLVQVSVNYSQNPIARSSFHLQIEELNSYDVYSLYGEDNHTDEVIKKCNGYVDLMRNFDKTLEQQKEKQSAETSVEESKPATPVVHTEKDKTL